MSVGPAKVHGERADLRTLKQRRAGPDTPARQFAPQPQEPCALCAGRTIGHEPKGSKTEASETRVATLVAVPGARRPPPTDLFSTLGARTPSAHPAGRKGIIHQVSAVSRTKTYLIIYPRAAWFALAAVIMLPARGHGPLAPARTCR